MPRRPASTSTGGANTTKTGRPTSARPTTRPSRATLHAAEVAVVELQFDAASGNWTNVGVVDLKQWEPTFPFDPESTGWVRQDPRSRVGWRRRSVLRKLFSRKKRDDKSGA
ncbi:MAG: hypothetical protein QM729_15005 [Solirubrobacterales bacterium]